MEKNAGLIAELERRARNAPTIAEGQRLQLEADRLRLNTTTGYAPSQSLRFAGGRGEQTP